MSSETRQIPNTNVNRRKALDAAKKKNDSVPAPCILTLTTAARLNAAQPANKEQQDLVVKNKTAMVKATNGKSMADNASAMSSSQFIQVFNFGILRGKNGFTNEDRAYYKLDVTTGNVPPMTTDAEILLVAENLVTGETNRITDGGTPMTNPDLAEIRSDFIEAGKASDTQNTATEAYNTSVTDLTAMNVESDAVIKKVWDEVETVNNELPPATARAACRLYGVIYALTGSTKAVTVTVLDIDTSVAIEGVDVSLENGKNSTITDIKGAGEFNTTLMKDQNLLATHLMYDDYTKVITLVENENISVTILMKKSL